jgi:hypothetical protein
MAIARRARSGSEILGVWFTSNRSSREEQLAADLAALDDWFAAWGERAAHESAGTR